MDKEEQNKIKAERLIKTIRALCFTWFLNLLLFMGSLFMRVYAEHFELWHGPAWAIVFATSAITKVVLSILIGAFIAVYHGMEVY